MQGFALALDPLPEGGLLDAPPARSGAVASFYGRVRDHNEGRQVLGLEYEAYAELALHEGNAIVDEAIERFGLDAAVAMHRLGSLAIGDAAVAIEVASAHRAEAFEACRWIIDQIKERLPIWKLERYAEGDMAWVSCTHHQ